jgi:hypothetical protein
MVVTEQNDSIVRKFCTRATLSTNTTSANLGSNPGLVKHRGMYQAVDLGSIHNGLYFGTGMWKLLIFRVTDRKISGLISCLMLPRVSARTKRCYGNT